MEQSNKKEIEEELKKHNFDVATISFRFNMTRDEAKEVLESKHNKTSREFAKYFRALVEAAAKRFTLVPEGEDCPLTKVQIDK